MKSTFMTNGNLMVALFSTKTEWIKRGGLYDLYMLSTWVPILHNTLWTTKNQKVAKIIGNFQALQILLKFGDL